MSAGFLGSGGNKFRDALPAQRKVVDTLLQRFRQEPALPALDRGATGSGGAHRHA